MNTVTIRLNQTRMHKELAKLNDAKQSVWREIFDLQQYRSMSAIRWATDANMGELLATFDERHAGLMEELELINNRIFRLHNRLLII